MKYRKYITIFDHQYFIDIEKEKCEIHNQKLEYYCITCAKIYCCDCIILNKHDQSHQIIKNSDQHYKQYELLTLRKYQINQYISFLNNDCPRKIDEKIEQIQNETTKKLAILDNLTQKIREKSQLLINELKELKGNLSQQEVDLHKLDNNIDCSITNGQNMSETNKNINDFLQNLNSKNNIINTIFQPVIFDNNYEILTFEISNYPKIIREKDPTFHTIISPIYKVNFLSWKIIFHAWDKINTRNVISLLISFNKMHFNHNSLFRLIMYYFFLIQKQFLERKFYFLFFSSMIILLLQ